MKLNFKLVVFEVSLSLTIVFEARVGFEPTCGFRQPVLQTVPIVHSSNEPLIKIQRKLERTKIIYIGIEPITSKLPVLRSTK